MKTILTVLFCGAVFSFANAQFLDSFKIEFGTLGTIAAKDHQPHWLVSNKFGTVTDQRADVSTNLRLTNRHSYGKVKQDSAKPFYVQYGVNLYNNNQFKQVFFEEAFLKAGYKNWQLRAGRFEEITGEVDRDLSSGSLGISGNALPIPKVGVIVTDYTNVPFTSGWLQFKGQFSHGWFGNDRYMKNAFLHEKILYMRLGKKKLKLHAGIQHFAEWGGRREGVQLERSFKGFLDVLFVREADDGSVGTAINGIPPNRPGDQRGLLELGLTWENETFLLRTYHQTPFETGRDVDFRNVDKLAGVSFVSKSKHSFIKGITVEVLSTKDMLSFVEQSDRQSFYNNGAYKTGWEYQSRIIGTPLFINRARARHYFSDVYLFDWNAPGNTIFGNDNIINNRVLGGHIGMLFSLLSKFSGKTFITYTKNYGTHGANRFSPHKVQLYLMQQFSYSMPRGINLTAGVGYDAGDLTNNVGFMVGVRKEISNFGNSKR